MLKLADQNDFPHILRMARNFHEASPYTPLSFNEERCLEFFQSYLMGDKTEVIIILAVDEDYPFGMIIGQAGQPAFSNQRVSQELAWWIDPEYRGTKDSLMLLQSYEDWSLRVGCKITQVAMLDGSTNLEKYYTKRGFTPAEYSYIKEVK